MADILQFCEGMEAKTFAPGEVMIRESGESDRLFVLIDGQAQPHLVDHAVVAPFHHGPVGHRLVVGDHAFHVPKAIFPLVPADLDLARMAVGAFGRFGQGHHGSPAIALHRRARKIPVIRHRSRPVHEWRASSMCRSGDPGWKVVAARKRLAVSPRRPAGRSGPAT